MSYGDHCTSCSCCCKAIPCSLGIFAYGDHRPCKALEEIDGKYYCGLVLKPSDNLDIGEHAEWKDTFLSNMFGIGMGCCSNPASEILHTQMRNAIKRKNT